MSRGISTSRTVNYDSKTHAVVDSQISGGSFSIKIRQVKRVFLRLSSSRSEDLIQQKTLNPSSAPIVLEIPPCFLLAGEEHCRDYVSWALLESKAIKDKDSWIRALILPKICKDAMELGKTGRGFMVEAEVEAVKETYLTDFVPFDIDSQGLGRSRRIPKEPESDLDCPICLKEFGDRRRIITRLCCCHCFHRDCILRWLRRTPSCPICRDDIHNPRPTTWPMNYS